MRCDSQKCTGSMLANMDTKVKTKEEILSEAVDFINQFYISTKQ